MTDSSRNGSAVPPLHETPEAGAVQTPTWRDQFAGSANQTPEAEVRIPVTNASSANEPAAAPRPTGAPVEESVLQGGDLTPESLMKAAKDFIDATPEERDAQARQAAEKLKPLAAEAEKVAAKALDLGSKGLEASAKGLANWAHKLGERHKDG